MKHLIKIALRAAYQCGRDNGERRSEKNFNDFLETTISKKVFNKIEEVELTPQEFFVEMDYSTNVKYNSDDIMRMMLAYHKRCIR